jgi:hypothetical protein
MIERYQSLTSELAALSAGHAGALARADRALAAASAPESHDVDAANEALRVANEAAWAAAKRCVQVDARAERIWAELGAYLGRRGRRLGALPSPEADLTFGGTTAARSPRRAATAGSARGAATVGSARAAAMSALDRASDTIARSARGEPIGAVPGWALALLPLVGAGCALVVSYPMRALTGLSVLGAVAQIMVLVAPFAGLPLSAWWVRDRFGCRADGGVMGLTALGGMIAACATAFV